MYKIKSLGSNDDDDIACSGCEESFEMISRISQELTSVSVPNKAINIIKEKWIDHFCDSYQKLAIAFTTS